MAVEDRLLLCVCDTKYQSGGICMITYQTILLRKNICTEGGPCAEEIKLYELCGVQVSMQCQSCRTSNHLWKMS